MKEMGGLAVQGPPENYKSERIQDQADWYGRKSILNRKKSSKWFLVSVTLHAVTIIMLLYRIKDPSISLPLGAITTAVSAVLTWLQAKKYNELASSYSLTAHEIALIKGMGLAISNEKELSDFVVNSEAAFSREHTQWFARKNE